MALTTFSDLVQEAREQVKRDALAASCSSPREASSCSSPQRGEAGRGDNDNIPTPPLPRWGGSEGDNSCSSPSGGRSGGGTMTTSPTPPLSRWGRE